MENLILTQDDLVNNPTARVPICLVLDTSTSMEGEPIKELEEGVKLFFKSLLNDEIAKYSAEISVITFGEEIKVSNLQSIENIQNPSFEANGNTPMGKAVNISLDILENRKKDYSNAGVDYYQPWMVLMTDGQPTDDIELAAKRTSELISGKKLTFFPIGIGENADMQILKMFSPKRDPLRLKGLNFREFFEWLSKSVSRVSQSIPGDKIQLDLEGIKGWGEL